MIWQLPISAKRLPDDDRVGTTSLALKLSLTGEAVGNNPAIVLYLAQ